MTTTAILPWNMYSEGAKSLSTALGAPLISRDSAYLWGGKEHCLINWGCGDMNAPMPGTLVLNNSLAVQTCIDKRFFFRTPPNFSRPPHTETYSVALNWVREGKTVLARTRVSGYDGDGLVVVKNEDELPLAKLYTEFMESDSEWRVHLFRGEIIIQQQRVRRSCFQDIGADSPIRISRNGYGFNISDCPSLVIREGRKCFEEFDLDFAALDIIYNSRDNKAYVLEINSAPELTPYCVEKYSKAFREVIEQYGR